MNTARVLPDFLIIPYQVIVDPKLQPTDRLLYGLIYWYEHMKLEKCVASNETLATLLAVSTRAVRGGLERLEKRGFILRVFADSEHRNRTEIKALVRFRVGTNVPTRRNRHSVEVGTNVPHINKTYKEDLSMGYTPKLKTLKERYPDLTL
jgi:hypothetical protein